MEQAPSFWDEPCYAISVAAEMVSLHPQTLRRYEEFGLVTPARKAGRRLYSPRDIELLRHICRLSDDLGLNLAGVEVAIRLNEQIRRLQAEIENLHTERADLEAQIALLQDQIRAASL